MHIKYTYKKNMNIYITLMPVNVVWMIIFPVLCVIIGRQVRECSFIMRWSRATWAKLKSRCIILPLNAFYFYITPFKGVFLVTPSPMYFLSKLNVWSFVGDCPPQGIFILQPLLNSILWWPPQRCFGGTPLQLSHQIVIDWPLLQPPC